MSEVQKARQCADCKAAMHPVKLIAKTVANVAGEAHSVVCLYAAEQAKAHWLSRTFSTEGIVRAWLCDLCGRVALYADPAGDNS
jgi:hypothetical protein